jgi:hypothetical protein
MNRNFAGKSEFWLNSVEKTKFSAAFWIECGDKRMLETEVSVHDGHNSASNLEFCLNSARKTKF